MILITGATDGIGLETARQLALQGHEVVLHGRSEDKAQRARIDILRSVPQAKLHTTHADLADLAAVARMARELNERLPKLDVLINNAGVYLTGPQLSKDGYEMTWAVNHLAHFLLTLRLLPLLKKSSEPRVVTVSSMVHSSGRLPLSELRTTAHYEGYQAYANSKLANALFARELARREPWLSSNSLHPGVIGTKLLHAAFSMPGSAVSDGARTSVMLATAPEVKGISGKYFDDCRVAKAAASVNDEQLAQQLWDWSELAVQRWLPG
ncbi:MAG TPA: SDR family NAD(P)-dependent oxidoreductase [Gallionellaceae bacterium]